MTTEILQTFTKLREPLQRADSAKALAHLLGADELLIFYRDPEYDVVLPAPGFPQTLPEGRKWSQFLAQCVRIGECSDSLPSPFQKLTMNANGWLALDESVLVLLGGKPDVEAVRMVIHLVPLACTSFRYEQKAQASQTQLDRAQEAAKKNVALVAAVDEMRRQLQTALLETHQQRQQLDFLLEISNSLSGLGTGEQKLTLIASKTVPAFADFCFIGLRGRDGKLHTLRIEAVSPDDVRDCAEVIIRLVEVSSAKGAHLMTPEKQQTDPLHQTLAELGFSSWIVAPLTFRGETSGAMVFATTRGSGRTFGESDLVLASDLAARTAVAVDNANLYFAIENQQNWLESILDLMPTPFMLLEPGSGRLLFSNKAAYEISQQGTEVGDRMWSACVDLNGRPLPPEQSPIARAARGERLNGLQVQLVTRTKLLPILAFSDILPAMHGQAETVAFAFQDVSRLRETELKLQEALESLKAHAGALQESNRDLEQFAAVAAHDLKAPLSTIVQAADLLQTEFTAEVGSEGKIFLDMLTQAATRMATLIDSLLSYSRIATTHEQPKVVSCERVFDVAISNLRSLIEGEGAQVTHGPLPSVIGHEQQLIQLFQNLIGNGIKFHKQNIAPNVHVEAHISESMWVLSFKDNGIGIDPSKASRVFEMFQRLHTAIEYQGTGIGLATCKKIAERHGGQIWLESNPEQGSTFYVSLPQEKQSLISTNHHGGHVVLNSTTPNL